VSEGAPAFAKLVAPVSAGRTSTERVGPDHAEEAAPARHGWTGDPDTWLRGVWNIVPTPFDAAGELDEASLRRLIDFVIATGVQGITILGVLGEAGKLSETERSRVIAVTLEAAAGRIPVCVGVTHAATDRCLAYAREAGSAGAAALMVAPPSLAKPNEAALRRHFEAVAEAVSLPLVVQDFPPASGVYLSPAFIGSLATELPACRWLKLEDDPTPQKVSAVLAAQPEVRIFGGLGGAFLLEELQRGAVGTMTGFGFPEILVAVSRRWAAGDVVGARDVFYRYLPLIRFENQAGINLPLRKHLYQRRGAIADGRARSPHAVLDAITLQELDALLDHLGLRTPGIVTID
jgi:4-hydroxy-tetrahydrodipicolinate synthase